MPPKPARRGNQSNNLDPKECSTLRYPLPSLRDGRLLTGRKRDFLDKQRAVMRGSPGPAACCPLSARLPAVRSCTTTIKKKSSQSTRLLTTMIPAPAPAAPSAAATTAFVTSQRTDGRRMLSSLQFTNSSLSRGFRYEGEQGG